MIPDRPRLPSSHPGFQIQVTDDGSRTLIDPQTDVAFHSGCGAVEETRWVYLRNSGVQTLLETGRPTRVLEVGVGLGLGCLMTVDAALKFGTPLEYVGYESTFPNAAVLAEMEYRSILQSDDLFGHWIDWRKSLPERVTGSHSWQVSEDVRVNLVGNRFVAPDCVGDPVDAIYFDPFDPATNPEAWTRPVFAGLTAWAGAETRLVTYCVKRSVRDAMRAAGWRVDRVHGPPGGKREVAVARLE